MKKIKPQKKKIKNEQSAGIFSDYKKLAIIWGGLLLVVLAGALVGYLVFGDRTVDDVPPDTSIDFPDEIVYDFPYELRIGDLVLTNAEYNFHFEDMKINVLNEYWDAFGFEVFDFFTDVREQMHPDGDRTWADYIHDRVDQMFLMYAQALAEGISLTDSDLDMLAITEEEIVSMAMQDGVTLDQLVGSYFPGMTWAMYRRYMERDLLIRNWRAAQIDAVEITSEEVESYFRSNWRSFAPTSAGHWLGYSSVDVRHILVLSELIGVDEAREIAEEILEEWLNGEATEESFAYLATNRTEDPGSMHTGGLYDFVMRGQMVPSFDAWIFDGERQFGDTDIVETSHGSHVMFFAGGHEPSELWYNTTLAFMRHSILTDAIENLPILHNLQREGSN